MIPAYTISPSIRDWMDEHIVMPVMVKIIQPVLNIVIAVCGFVSYVFPPVYWIAALIAAIGGFALSKKLTKRERLLLLDEIETELEVVDKELSIADSNNEIKKYRELLKYKKDLQRQYQRIKYNIRIGKDILPSSTAGVGFSD